MVEMKKILAFIKPRKKISCKALMKKFNIGYSRAAGILQELEKKGIVSEAKPDRARRVL